VVNGDAFTETLPRSLKEEYSLSQPELAPLELPTLTKTVCPASFSAVSMQGMAARIAKCTALSMPFSGVSFDSLSGMANTADPSFTE
jgi:hypothetical protein